MTRTALITGGNRGIGLEACRQLATAGIHVVMATRDKALGEEAAAELSKDKLDVRVEQMDVTSDSSVLACAERLDKAKVHVDIVVNNAAINLTAALLDKEGEEQLRKAAESNLFGPVRVSRAFVPGMIKGKYGRVVNVSSGWGSFAEGLEGPPPYSITKAALNAFTVKLAKEVGAGVKVNSMCPGWVRTRMGGDAAPRTVQQGADTILWLATLPDDGPTGGFFRDRKPIQW